MEGEADSTTEVISLGETEEKVGEVVEEAVDLLTEPNSNGSSTITIDPAKIAEEKTSKIKVNFSDKSFLKQYLQQDKETKTATSNAEKVVSMSANPNQTEAERLQAVKDDLDKQAIGDTLSVEDYEDFADVIVEMIDWALAWACMWWAKDTTDEPYMQNERKMKTLKKMLSRLMIRNSSKFNFTILFFVIIVVAYGASAKKANQHRKKVLDKQNEKKRVVTTVGQETEQPTEEEQETNIIDIETKFDREKENEQRGEPGDEYEEFNRVDIQRNYFLKNAA